MSKHMHKNQLSFRTLLLDDGVFKSVPYFYRGQSLGKCQNAKGHLPARISGQNITYRIPIFFSSSIVASALMCKIPVLPYSVHSLMFFS